MRAMIVHNSPVSSENSGRSGFLPAVLLAAALAALLVAPRVLPAQATVVPPSAHKLVHTRKQKTAASTPAPAPPAAAAPATPPAPEVPVWPANDKPAPATINWDSNGLRIEAANSSLAQILVDVSTVTGTKMTGFDGDARVFGVYGPAPEREVISQLLQGSGYNIVMVGDQGEGTPREIVLSSRHSGDSQPLAANPSPSNSSDDDTASDEQPQPVQQPPVRPGFPPGGPARTPQQIQEMLQRQQRPGMPQSPSIPQN
jgi:hypothetical protein